MVIDVVPVKCEPLMVIVEPIAPADAGENELIEAKTELLFEGVFFLQEKNEKKQIVMSKTENFMNFYLSQKLIQYLLEFYSLTEKLKYDFCRRKV